MTNVTQSLKHLKWRLSSEKIIPNEKDIEAFNNIVAYVGLTEQTNMDSSKLFVKLFTYILTFNSKYYGHNVKRVLDDIENVLGKSIYQNMLEFHINIPMCNVTQLWNKHDTIYVEVNNPPTNEDLEKIAKAEQEQMKRFALELKKSLQTEYTEQQLLEFITKKTTELTAKYQSYE